LLLPQTTTEPSVFRAAKSQPLEYRVLTPARTVGGAAAIAAAVVNEVVYCPQLITLPSVLSRAHAYGAAWMDAPLKVPVGGVMDPNAVPAYPQETKDPSLFIARNDLMFALRVTTPVNPVGVTQLLGVWPESTKFLPQDCTDPSSESVANAEYVETTDTTGDAAAGGQTPPLPLSVKWGVRDRG